MILSRIRTYERLYKNSRYMGAAGILRKFLGVGDETPVPLSLSHGVDFGHCHRPMDVDAIEPIHWSCNREIHEEALRVKPSILAPHPWAMTVSGKADSGGKGVLVIGPPPSPENDQRLYDLIKADVRSDWTVLVKARGHYEGSLQFWKTNGLQTLTAMSPDDSFYERLHGILSRFRTVVGCTFSSALVFAASIGREVTLLRNYYYEAYEPVRYEDEVNFGSRRAKSVVSLFANQDHAACTQTARTLLGFQMLEDKARILRELVQAIAALRRPFNANPENPIPYKLSEFIAVKLGKSGVLKYSPRDVLERLRRRNLSIMRINDIDVWLSGKGPSNFTLTPVVFQEGVTVAGLAPGGYLAVENAA